MSEDKLVSADELLNTIRQWEALEGDYAESFSNDAGVKSAELPCVEDAIENAEAVDAVKVVRCQKCCNGVPSKFGDYVCKKDNRTHAGEWYCADGKEGTPAV